MNNNECRIIKINRDALYEFIYENFIANHEEFMDMDAVGNMNTFAINWETGEFIFCAHKDENEKGEIAETEAHYCPDAVLRAGGGGGVRGNHAGDS